MIEVLVNEEVVKLKVKKKKIKMRKLFNRYYVSGLTFTLFMCCQIMYGSEDVSYQEKFCHRRFLSKTNNLKLGSSQDSDVLEKPLVPPIFRKVFIIL